ncbi:DUF969 domain-containing protein [Alkaliphilus peptidifermentans]|uniref:Uncharacterized membrane protein n=1 Tax=Alkaliphilus peptidifermentans DSM 18978 TaxID=1120976 RepID=A0A1G5IKL3_9FIRM|nr:DUF969 domain-containing protein [Alkaliphilus peptidifermentans]SCY76537.1 Uncharacterized membrane protein [Alkaliphilus peptidifermentans DSM 18978]
MELIKLLGILIVIIGFALKKDSILIILCAAIVTALVGGLGITGLLNTLGTSFVANRAMAIFILIMFVTGTLERNGLKDAAASLIEKIKGASPGKVIGAYGIMRGIFGAFNVSFGGVAGFVRPIIMPMAAGSIEAKGEKVNEDHLDEIKGMASGMENIAWFFCQVLFVGGAGGLLVQSTLASLGYHVELIDLVKVEIPVAIVAVSVAIVYYYLKDKKLCKKYYSKDRKEEETA